MIMQAPEDVKDVTLGEVARRLDSIERNLLAVLTERDLRYEQRWASSESAVRAALESSNKAIEVAMAANEKRLDSTNEWRQALTDLTSKNLTREEWMQGHKSLEHTVDEVRSVTAIGQQRLLGMEGRISSLEAWQTWGMRIVLGLVLAAMVAAVLVSNASSR